MKQPRRDLLTMLAGLSLSLLSLQCLAIGNGEIVTPDHFEAKSAVQVLKTTKEKSSGRIVISGYCSGTLVSPQLVITAGHCISKLGVRTREDGSQVAVNEGPIEPSNILIYFGNHQEGTPRDISLLRRVIHNSPHPDFWREGFAEGKSISRDVGLLKMADEAPAGFEPIEMLLDPTRLAPDAPIIIAGFGNTHAFEDPRNTSSTVLRRFHTLIRDPNDKVLGSVGQIQLYKTQDLPAYKAKYESGTEEDRKAIDLYGLLAGDSGGPAYMKVEDRPFLVGVASGYDSQNHPTYENLANVSSWIKETVAAMTTPP